MICRLVGLLPAATALALASPAFSESVYPTPTRDGRERIQRIGACPTGFVGKGLFCEALHRDTPRAMPKIAGTACPAGWFASSGYCVSLR